MSEEEIDEFSIKDIDNHIIELKPNIKRSTIDTYIRNLERVKVLLKQENYEFLEGSETITEIQNMGKSYTTKRNYYNSIIIFLQAYKYPQSVIDKYIEARDQGNQEYEEAQESGKISDKQSENFVPKQDIIDMINKMGQKLKGVKFKDNFTQTEFNLLQKYILFNIYIRLPLRNDVAGMITINKRQYNKLKLDDKVSNNYLVNSSQGMFMVLNEYKTSAKYAEKVIEIPKDLQRWLRSYIKVNGLGVLFKSNRGNAYTRNQLSQIFMKTSQEYLGKNISTTLLRKIYLSDKYSEVKKEMAKDAYIMGHSVETQQKIYTKDLPQQGQDKQPNKGVISNDS